MKQSEYNSLRDGVEEANREMTVEIEKAAPVCHYRLMCLEQSDSIDGYYTEWWECSVCGHTKDL